MYQLFAGNQAQPDPNRMSLAQEMLRSAIGERCSKSEFAAAVDRMEGIRKPGRTLLVRPDASAAAQRVRIMTAMLAAVSEVGPFDVTIESVVSRAAVERPRFYYYFENKDECFLACYRLTDQLLRGRIETAVAAEAGDWRDRLRAALAELLYFATYEVPGARLLLAGRNVLCGVEVHDSLVEHFSGRLGDLLREGTGNTFDRVVLDGLVGGIEYVLSCALHKEEPGDLRPLLPDVMDFCVRSIDGSRQD